MQISFVSSLIQSESTIKIRKGYKRRRKTISTGNFIDILYCANPCYFGFQWGSFYWICSFMCMFWRWLFVLFSFFIWPLCCLFFNLRILITPLVSSNSSYLKLGYSNVGPPRLGVLDTTLCNKFVSELRQVDIRPDLHYIKGPSWS